MFGAVKDARVERGYFIKAIFDAAIAAGRLRLFVFIFDFVFFQVRNVDALATLAGLIAAKSPIDVPSDRGSRSLL